MKKYLKIFSYVYSLVILVFIIISFSILRNLNIDTPFLRLAIGGLIISVFISGSIVFFKAKSLNTIIRVIGGFIIILPVIFITRNLFGVMVFRYSSIVYAFALLCALTYSVIVLLISHKSKKEEKELNDLISKK